MLELMDTSQALVSVENRTGVAVVTMKRPARRNALGTASMQALRDILADADKSPDVGAIVLTGAPPAFCSGSDLKELGGLSVEAMCEHEKATASVARAIGHLSKPVVAAVEGYALGGGFILAISCDLVVSASNARWHLPEVMNGWLPPWGLGALIARVGPVKARRLTWGFEPIDGAEALQMGVADFVAAPGDALMRAQAIAERLAALPGEARRSTKQFYQQFVMAAAERLDDQASRLFASDCGSSAARNTLDRFKVNT